MFDLFDLTHYDSYNVSLIRSSIMVHNNKTHNKLITNNNTKSQIHIHIIIGGSKQTPSRNRSHALSTQLLRILPMVLPRHDAIALPNPQGPNRNQSRTLSRRFIHIPRHGKRCQGPPIYIEIKSLW